MLSNYLCVHKGKALVGTFLTIGVTLISAAGQLSFQLAVVVEQLVVGIVFAVLSLWVVYPFFPEDP
ncbi:MAG: hypothetical protein OSB41_08615, partial [Kiritimatiellae bacterium]|nr:hypothetical protein [Kiritimatiellia bacterium]